MDIIPNNLKRYSILAIIETIIASTIAIILAYELNQLWLIVLSSCIAPLLLMSSRGSIIEINKGVDKLLESLGEPLGKRISKVFAMVITIPYFFILKTFLFWKFFVSNPIYSIKQIPSNYYYNVFVLNLRHSPELIPGTSNIKNMDNTLNLYYIYESTHSVIYRDIFSTQLEAVSESKAIFKGKFRAILFWGTFYIFIILPMTILAFSFRYCVKSTALLWLPLLWVLYQANPGKDIKTKIEITVNQPWYKVVVFYSVFVCVFFISKIYLYMSAYDISLPNSFGPFKNLIENLIDSLNLPLWQIAGFINAILALLFYNESKKYSLSFGTIEAWSSEKAKLFFSTFQVIRATISIYTIICFLYILASSALNKNMIPMNIPLFPNI